MTRSIPVARREESGERYIPTFIGVLVLIVGVILILNALASLVAAISVFFDGFVQIARISSEQRRPFVGFGPFIVLVLSAGRWLVGAWLEYYIARKVIQGRRWAWFVAIVLTAIGMIAVAYAEAILPIEVLLLLPHWWKLAVYGPGTFIIGVLSIALAFDWIIAMSMSRTERRATSIR